MTVEVIILLVSFSIVSHAVISSRKFSSNMILANCALIGQFAVVVVLFLVFGVDVHSYPVPQMRICIQSVDPNRLPSQCIYCKSRLFPLTVRLCTGNSYLPARMSLNEAACLTAACRKQLPRLPPEPYSISRPSYFGNIFNNNNNIGNGGVGGSSTTGNEDMSYNQNMDAANEENYEEAESLMAEKPTKVRPPAKFFLGKPQKIYSSIKPMLFG